MSEMAFETEAREASDRQAQQATSVAEWHLIFLHDERAQKLLALWKQACRTRTPPGSPIDVYARKEAIREFVETIENQIEIAKRTDIFA